MGRIWKPRKQITPRQLGNLLKLYRVHSRDVHLNGKHGKGYRLADFQKPFKRYLPSTLPSIRANVRDIDYEGLMQSSIRALAQDPHG